MIALKGQHISKHLGGTKKGKKKKHYLGYGPQKLKATHPVEYFPGFFGRNIKNCPPSKLFLFTSMTMLKGTWSYYSKFSFLFHLQNHHSKDVNFKYQLNGQAVWMYKAIWYIKVASILLCISLIITVTITRYVFIYIFQTGHFSAVKFSMGYEKNMSFLVIAKSPKV